MDQLTEFVKSQPFYVWIMLAVAVLILLKDYLGGIVGWVKGIWKKVPMVPGPVPGPIVVDDEDEDDNWEPDGHKSHISREAFDYLLKLRACMFELGCSDVADITIGDVPKHLLQHENESDEHDEELQ